ncbi:UDP-glucuronate 5-epimerase [Devosia sp. Leaf420]|uniref:SDR family NAD(P)-dependent oxidoreductase n=1 Tax=Devosia sp. Leaf420 TaxID=1736374 RepID=UPI00071365F4|nr:SDR family NAD(P)-dependent oxidoreductase [Devosia sp. Leaf420]KQT49354.1 UDP-glucuronate 5-epimerase [Devosia sp. Leaf420]
MKILVTGAAGFIGFHLSQRLLAGGHQVLGYDGMTKYYDVSLKEARLAILQRSNAFSFVEAMLEDKSSLDESTARFDPEVIIHLAAQAGVRYSLEAPEAYISANVVGTFNILELAKKLKPKHLLIASTSSVYGGNEKMPFEEADRTDFPVSLYAATKKACEAMSHSYAHLFKIPTTCFRFFTVYGPWGRPDMALYKFVDAIEQGRPIDVYGMGQMQRDSTAVTDLVEGITRLIDAVPQEGNPITTTKDSLSPVAPWRVVNIAGGRPTALLDFISAIENVLGRPALKNMLPMQQGDVVSTSADPSLLQALTGFVPNTSIEKCVQDFVEWYRTYSLQ